MNRAARLALYMGVATLAAQPVLQGNRAVAQEALPEFDPGILAAYFDVGPVRIENVEFVDVLGRISYLRSYVFVVEAKRSFSPAAAIFLAHFHDADGVRVDFAPVQLEPEFVNWWQPGMRGRVTIRLPLPHYWARTRLVRISDLSER